MNSKGFKIGEVQIKNKIVLAPMAGVCNITFRIIAKEFGAGLVCTEMISDKGLLYGNAKTLGMLSISQKEKPVSLQIFGGEIETLVQAAKIIEEKTCADIIDINMGCPVPKIIKSEAGAKLLLNPDRIYDIVKAVSSAVNLPVTVKIRMGWDEKHIFAVENAKAIEAGGGKAVAIHGRTRVQMYEGIANWDIIGEVKQNVNIPVIGNGDIKKPEDAKKMLEYTKCDAVMIGRASLGNPWMIYKTAHFLNTNELIAEPSDKEKIDICLMHLDNLIAQKGNEKLAVREMRKHAAWYLKGIRGNAGARRAINEANSRQEIINIFADLIKYSQKNCCEMGDII